MWSASSVSQREGVVATPGSAHIKRDLRPPHSMVTTKAQRIQNHASHKEGFEKRFGSAQGRREGAATSPQIERCQIRQRNFGAIILVKRLLGRGELRKTAQVGRPRLQMRRFTSSLAYVPFRQRTQASGRFKCEPLQHKFAMSQGESPSLRCQVLILYPSLNNLKCLADRAMSIYRLGKDSPTLDEGAWVAPNAAVGPAVPSGPEQPPAGQQGFRVEPLGAERVRPAQVMGKVKLCAGASVWFNATVRGDNELCTIGKGSNVQDGSVLHTDMGFPLTIGENVTVGHMAMLHGCEVGEGSLIGIGATVLNGVRIGKNCL